MTVKDASENSSELEQKKFSFNLNSAEKGEESIIDADVDVAKTETSVSGASSESGEPDNVAVDSSSPDSRGCLPGGVLSAERQRRGLSISEIANQLFLTEKQISALENDDYEHFPAPIFVTGYIRNYARLLDIPADPLIELFNSKGAAPEPELDRVNRTAESVVSSKSGAADSRLFIGAVVVLVLIVLVWWGMSQTPEPKAVDDAVAIDEAASVSSVTTSSEVIPTVKPEVKPIEVSPAKKSVESVAIEAPTVATSDSEAEADIPPEPEFIADRDAALALPDTMVLVFSAESWIEITDANERRVMFDLGKPGQTRELSGTAPFNILFGYSPAVKMTFNGEAFDQSRYARGKVARFTLGSNSE